VATENSQVVIGWSDTVQEEVGSVEVNGAGGAEVQ
jgi:hypothetical protein